MTQSLPDWLNPDKYPPVNVPSDEGELPPFSDIPTPNQAEKADPSFGRSLFSAAKEVLETIVPAIIIALLINLFLAQATRVYGQSMEPNLHTDQRLVVEKISYRFRSPQRGDIVVLKIREKSEELLIKRVIALPGETIEIKDGYVFINGQKLKEPYLSQPTRGHYGPTTVPPEYVFVLGDNRGASNDSRSFGAIPIQNLIGHAWLSYWPVEDVGLVH